jgi:hypothetical protein
MHYFTFKWFGPMHISYFYLMEILVDMAFNLGGNMVFV